jgi:hypothetical protein
MGFRLFRQRRSPSGFYVLLQHEDGPPSRVGPMTRYAAELFIAHELAHHPFHFKRRVTSARIIS